jgi:hypothetical protein
VLLYCGDHDPDGLRISETLRKNLEDVAEIRWEDGTDGYDPSNLEIARFGLEYDFILKNRLTWINNLITGSGKDLGDAGSIIPCRDCGGKGKVGKGKVKLACERCGGQGKLRVGAHPNHYLPYVQDYLKKIGRRKCEANSIVVVPQMGRQLCLDTVRKYLGRDAEERFAKKRELVRERIDAVLEKSGAGKHIRKAISLLDKFDT